MLGAPRQLVGALALERDDGLAAVGRRHLAARSRGRARRRRSRSPGPRLAVVAGARTTIVPLIARHPRRGSTRRSARPPIVASVSTSTAAVSLSPWPVRTQTTVLPGSSSTCASPAKPAADDGSQKMPSRLAISSHASVISVVGDGDDLDAAVGDERVDLVEVRGLGDADRGGERRRRARRPAPRRAAARAPSSAKPFA